jgi:hypothetical protein
LTQIYQIYIKIVSGKEKTIFHCAHEHFGPKGARQRSGPARISGPAVILAYDQPPV